MNEILKFRAQLMGFAILGVLICHNQFLIGLHHLFSFGSIGVEIFFFLSGMGLALSWKKEPVISRFYQKRFIRILPSYYLIIIFLSVLSLFWGHVHPNMYKSLLVVGPWMWFLSFLAVFYAVFPLYMKVCRHVAPPLLFAGITLGTMLALTVGYFTLPADVLFEFDMHYGRIPSFFLGCLWVQLPKEKTGKKAWLLIAGLALAALFIAFHGNEVLLKKTGVVWVLRMLFTPGFCYGLALLCALAEKIHAAVLLRLMAFIGSLTLEIYLLEGYFRYELAATYPPVWHAVGWLPTLLSAYLINRAADRVKTLILGRLKAREQMAASKIQE